MSKQDGRSRQVNTTPVDDTGATILHVDMDAFFASVELLSRPELRGTPVIVGGIGPRSVVSAANYEARRYGVNSAMPMSLALRRCPNAIVLPGQLRPLREVLRGRCWPSSRTPPRWSSRSRIDEAFLDVVRRPARARFAERDRADDPAPGRRPRPGSPARSASPATKYVAKVASSRAKPDGMLVVPVAETLAFLHPLAVGALWGVGPTTEETAAPPRPVDGRRRRRHAVRRAALDGRRRRSRPSCTRWRTASTRARCRPQREEKSIGREVTFSYDVTDESEIRRAHAAPGR